jgi:hypothetical protein
MQLLALTPAEIAFLTTPAATAADAAPDGFHLRLAHKLAATLSARLHLPVRAQAAPADAADPAPSNAPLWQPDTALATLWLTRRLGGWHLMGTSPFVPRSLLHTLDAALAECWLDAPAQTPPPALAWQLACDLGQAGLAVQLPLDASNMTRWARELIRHG